MTKTKTPKRLRLKPGCSIMGLIKDKTLIPGLYARGKNLTEEVFDKLLTDEFSHAVEVLPDKPPEEPLASIIDAPKEDEGIARMRRKREKEEQEFRERWSSTHGRPSQTRVD